VPRIFKILGVVFVWCVTCGAIRKDEFLCEEAHARLVECCPDAPKGESYCSFNEGCGSTSYPALSPEESNCIRESSCAKLRDSGACARAAAATPPNFDDDGGTPSNPWSGRAGVCQ
jgi:hypothetical protein